jgi:hypothetical protein
MRKFFFKKITHHKPGFQGKIKNNKTFRKGLMEKKRDSKNKDHVKKNKYIKN